jgi:signal transduction histidine kinase
MSDALTNINPRRIMHMAALGAFVVLGAMGLLTWQAMRLERREEAAQAQAQFQESLRLALWRIDSAMTPIIAREAARPYFEYEPFYPTSPPTESAEVRVTQSETGVAPAPGASSAAAPAPTAADQIFADATHERNASLAGPNIGTVAPGADGVMVPSPLLSNTDTFVNLHFQVQEDGTFTSPQAPQGRLKDLAESGYVTPYAVSRSEDRLGELRVAAEKAGRDVWATEGTRAVLDEAAGGEETEGHTGVAKEQAADAPPERQSRLQRLDTDSEYSARREALSKATQQYNTQSEELARGQQRGLSNRTRGAANEVRQEAAAPDTADKRVKADSPAPGAAQQDVASEGKNTPSHDGAHAQPRTKEEDEVALHDASSLGAHPSPTASTDAPASTPASNPSGTWGGDLIVQGQFVPRWLPSSTPDSEPELVFVRSVRVGGRTIEQGFWLDWPRLRAALLEPVKPLFPACTIRPVNAAGSSQPLGRMLATIPAELVVERAPAALASARWTPLRGVLVVVWVLVIGSVVAMFGIVRASIELAERRGRFVSAVTHELRTPLTTFCLYSQMLSDGMVPSEDAKRQYARTLHHESIRLTRIVESVLDFARLGRGSRAAFETLTLRDLRARIEPGLLAACERAEMRLDVTLTCDADQPVRTDPAILERVLGNLVDNACKYAKGGGDADRVILTWSIENGRLRASVRDFGPGVPFEEQTRVFDAFVRGRAHAHGSTPGLGLGLALSKGLAEQLSGELRMVQHAPGVEFVLDASAA